MNVLKKSIFNFIILVLMGSICTIFTACSGDDYDDIPGQDVPGIVTYYEPCFDWGTNADHVKVYMSGWNLLEGSNDYALMYYTNTKNITTISYSFLDGNRGLNMVVVNYITGDVNYIISEIERRYSITLTKDDKNCNKVEASYSGQGVIGGSFITVLLYSTTASQKVFFFVPLQDGMESLGVKSNRTINKYLQQKGIKANRK